MIKKCIVWMGLVVISGCATGSPDEERPDHRDNDPMIVQLSDTARQAFDQGEISKAVVMYRRALDRARAMDNSREIAAIAYNLSACLIALEDWDAAVKLLAEAEREARLAGEPVGPVMLLAAETARRQEQAGAAEAILDRMEAAKVSDDIRGQAYVLRAHIACDRGDAARAAAHVQRASGYLAKSNRPGWDGALAEVSGRIAELSGAWAEAGAYYDREASAMQRARRLPEMALALEKAGRNYVKAERIDTAVDRFFRAARSLMAQGNYLDALRVIEQAAPLQPGEEGQQTMTVIAELFEEIRRSVEGRSQAEFRVE